MHSDSIFLLSLLECHSRLHDPVGHVVLCWNHRWDPLFCPLFSLREVQSLLCCWHHVLRFEWVVAAAVSEARPVMHRPTMCIVITDLVTFKNVPLPLSLSKALFVLLAMAIYTGVTVNFLGKRFGDWRFSWSYILGWVALLMTFFAGLLKKKRSVTAGLFVISKNSTAFHLSCDLFCRYILHVRLQNARVQKSGWPTLNRDRCAVGVKVPKCHSNAGHLLSKINK